MYELMIKLFDKGYGIDRTYGTLKEKHFDVDYDYVACEYQTYHKYTYDEIYGELICQMVN